MIRKHGNFDPVQERADVTRNDILEAAQIVFSNKGYAGANTKNIAAAAGVATGSVYRYFKNKKIIFIEVMNMLQGQDGVEIYDTARNLFEEGKDFRDVLRLLGGASVEFHRNNRMFFREVMALEATDDEIAAIGRERDSRIRAALLELLQSRKDQIKVDDLEAASELIHLVISKISHHAVIFDSCVGEDRLFFQMLNMLEGYLSAS
ncbi:TetR/AcrR family transcriptional regulator [Maridesulfovibrio sp.]|uniref:TetR/AcrR family transcriptional regulator n=1 Tax=Maridesulfovibrio sp. TaxID=2795000 RepID=UPI0029F472A5|nr:TetR/AcrR family transcriptional regulator [Maridesulfovibrio sp.]